jgi:SAM-dependent methyltransferase
MPPSVPFDPHRFQSAAKHYFARPEYAPRLITRVAELCGPTSEDRIMDLGCGPGPLTVAFAPLVGSVVAVDPEPAMLELAAANTAAFGKKITFIQGSSNDLGPHFGSFKLVVIGRAFHWMDRAETARRLDKIVDADGALALFASSNVKAPETAWQKDYRAIIERYSDGEASWRGPDTVGHEVVLLDSPFSVLENVSVIERRTVPAETLVDRALSMSRTSPGRIGAEKAEALADEIRALAATAAIDGKLTEIVSSDALIARRPG